MSLRSLLWAALLSPTSAIAVSPQSTDAVEIMRAVEDRELGDRSVARLEIEITDKAGRKRSRTVRSWSMDFEDSRKQLMLFESPADVRNAGLLSVDYDDPARSDDQWLYLPSLSKTTRISGADKSGSFMGTDLTYADMTRRDIEDYEYAILEASAEVGGEAVWLIEARPKTDQERSETGYLKTHIWVSKDKLVPVQSKAWVSEGKRLKYTQFKDIKKVDGLWIAHTIGVRTVRNGQVESSSALVFTSIAFDQEEVTADSFSERRLEQGL